MLSYAIVVDSQKLFGKMCSLPAVILSTLPRGGIKQIRSSDWWWGVVQQDCILLIILLLEPRQECITRRPCPPMHTMDQSIKCCKDWSSGEILESKFWTSNNCNGQIIHWTLYKILWLYQYPYNLRIQYFTIWGLQYDIKLSSVIMSIHVLYTDSWKGLMIYTTREIQVHKRWHYNNNDNNNDIAGTCDKIVQWLYNK